MVNSPNEALESATTSARWHPSNLSSRSKNLFKPLIRDHFGQLFQPIEYVTGFLSSG